MSVLAKVASNKLAKNFSTLMLAQLASRALGVFYVAALARYVGTQGMGTLSTASALTGMLVLVIGPGLDTLLVRDVAVEPRNAGRYIVNALALKGLLGLPFLLMAVVIAHVAHYPADTLPIIYLYAIIYLVDALCSSMAAVFQGFQHMEYDGATQVARDTINIGLSLLAIYLGWSLFMITVASLVAQVAKFAIMWFIVRGRFALKFTRPHISNSKALLVASMSFGLLLILHTVQSQLGPLVTSLYYPASEVGVYSAASGLLTMLLMLVGVFATAVFPAYSMLHAQDSAHLERLYTLSYRYLLIIGFPLALGTILLGDRVVTLVYGTRFAAAAPVIRILGFYLFALVGYCNGPLLNAIGRQRFFAWTEGAAVVLNVVLCLVLVPRMGARGAALALVIAGCSTFFVHSWACYQHFGRGLPWGTLAIVAVATGFMGLAIVSADRLGVPWPFIVALVAPAAYLLALAPTRLLNRADLSFLASGAAAG